MTETLSAVLAELDNMSCNINFLENDLYSSVTFPFRNKYEIFLSPSKVDTSPKMASELAKQYGYCKTNSFHFISTPFTVRKQLENKAKRTSFEKFIPWSKITEAVDKGITTSYDLADFLELDEPFVREAVDYYHNVKQLSFNK